MKSRKFILTKLIEGVGIVLFISSLLMLCCIEWNNLSAQIVWMVIALVMFIVSVFIFNRFYVDGEWL